MLGNQFSTFDLSQTPYQGILHSTKPSATVRFPCMWVQGHLSQEMKNKLEPQSLCRRLQEGRRHGWTLEFPHCEVEEQPK